MSDSSEETKGKGLPATKVGGMRVSAHHEHNDKAIQTAPTPKTTVVEGVEAPNPLVVTPTEKKEKALAQHNLFKDVEKLQDPPLHVPEKKNKAPRKNQKYNQDIRVVQPSKMN